MIENQSRKLKFEQLPKSEQIISLILIVELAAIILDLVRSATDIFGGIALLILTPIVILITTFLLRSTTGKRMYVYCVIRFGQLLFTVDVYFNSDRSPSGILYIAYLFISTTVILYLVWTSRSALPDQQKEE